MRARLILPTVLVSVVALACGESLAEPSANGGDSRTVAPNVVPEGPPNIVVLLAGTATGEIRDIDGTPMDCFDVELFDLKTGHKIGDGADCLDLGSVVGDPTLGGFAISNTTFFNLPGGSIKSRNRTTIAPIVEGSPGQTHLTGDLAAANNILDGTGRFAGAEGIAQLFGSVNMSQFFSSNIISFNCVFVLSFDG